MTSSRAPRRFRKTQPRRVDNYHDVHGRPFGVATSDWGGGGGRFDDGVLESWEAMGPASLEIALPLPRHRPSTTAEAEARAAQLRPPGARGDDEAADDVMTRVEFAAASGDLGLRLVEEEARPVPVSPAGALTTRGRRNHHPPAAVPGPAVIFTIVPGSPASTASGLREGMPVRSIDGVSVLGWEIRDVVSHLSARTKPVQGDAEPLVVEFGLPRPERQTRRAARLKREAKAGRRKAVLATARLEREAAASAARAQAAKEAQIKDLAQLLAELPASRMLPPGQRMHFAKTAEERSFGAEATIVAAEEAGSALYLVQRGSAVVWQHNDHAEEGAPMRKLAELSAGKYWGSMAPLQHMKREAHVVAGPSGCACLILAEGGNFHSSVAGKMMKVGARQRQRAAMKNRAKDLGQRIDPLIQLLLVAHQQELAQACQRFDDSSTPRVTGPQLMEVLNSVDLDLEAAEIEQLGDLLLELGTETLELAEFFAGIGGSRTIERKADDDSKETLPTWSKAMEAYAQSTAQRDAWRERVAEAGFSGQEGARVPVQPELASPATPGRRAFGGWEEERQAEAKAAQEEEEAAPAVSAAAKPSTPRMLKSSLSDVVFSSLATP